MSNEQMFESVTAELRAAPEAAPREAWKATEASLFAAELAALHITPEQAPPTKKRYSKLKGAESAHILGILSKGVSSTVALTPKGVSTLGNYVEICTNRHGLCRLFWRAQPARLSVHRRLC